MRWSIRLAPVVFLSAFTFAACGAPPEAIRVELTAEPAADARIVVSGFSSREAAALGALESTDGRWQALMPVSVDGASVGVAGRYRVVDRRVEFTPAFPFDLGRSYRVVVDPTQLPQPREAGRVEATVALPGGAPAERVRITTVWPEADVWPANLLRFYIHFSGPMARESGAGRVHLVDDQGREDVTALLPSPIDFWSPDQTRYTVLFEPGRVKRGIGPNLHQGRPLVEGRTYSIVIDGDWNDAAGRPLLGAFRKTFRVGPARESALSMADWRVSSPSVGSRDPLVVTVPAPLDRALFARTVGVMAGGTPLAGVVDVVGADTEWRFTPASPWQRSAHDLVVLSSLEDPSGNRIGRAFEVLPTDPSANADPPERFVRPVTLR